jgi:hypothetical protein
MEITVLMLIGMFFGLTWLLVRAIDQEIAARGGR